MVGMDIEKETRTGTCKFEHDRVEKAAQAFSYPYTRLLMLELP